MAVVGVADQYMILMAITLLFTVLAISYRKNLVLGLLAGVTWMTSAISHFAIGDKTSALTWGLAWLFVGIGTIFIVRVVINTTRTLEDERWGTEMV